MDITARSLVESPSSIFTVSDAWNFFEPTNDTISVRLLALSLLGTRKYRELSLQEVVSLIHRYNFANPRITKEVFTKFCNDNIDVIYALCEATMTFGLVYSMTMFPQ
jgi:hypothetical protein